MILEVENISMQFGGLAALKNVSFSVPENSVVSVIGPNGAGKTTLFNAVTGIFPPALGEIKVQGLPIKESFSRCVAVRGSLCGVSVACLLVVALNIQTFWSAAVTEKYIYNQPFSYRAALGAIDITFANLSMSLSLLPATLGFLLGLSGYCAIWNRARYAPFVITKKGVARTFQNIRLFQSMSVIENVLVGMNRDYHTSFFDVAFRTKKYRIEEERALTKARELLSFIGLSDVEKQSSQALPYGSKRRLEIARALATRPKIILLDEPAAGMNPSELESLKELIREIRKLGVTVLLIEHHMKLVMNISDHIVVLDHGEKIAEGLPDVIKKSPEVIKAYLGSS